jgi:iron complex outermembrane receptor protein
MRRRTKHGERNMGATITIATLTVASLVSGASDSPARASISAEQRAGIVRSYQIPAGSMSKALNAVAGQNGLLLLYDAGLTESLRTPGLSGTFSTQEALDRLLAGTRLSYRFSADGETVSILLAQADTGVRNDAGAEALPPIDVGAQASEARDRRRAGAPQGPGDRFTGYNATSGSTALRTDTPLLRTPVSMRIVPRQTMDDQQAISVTDAIVGNSSGVQPNIYYWDSYKVRGFAIHPFWNGLYQHWANYIDTANVQSIEVVKGPAAVMYGRIDPGGFVSVLTKRPLETPYYSIQEQIGSWGLTRTTVDATGPLTADKTLLYRFNGEYFRKDSFIDFLNDRQHFLAPTLSWRPNEQFRANVAFESQHREYVADYPLFPALGGAPAPIPVSRYLQLPYYSSNPKNSYDQKRIAYDWQWDFLPGWSLTNRLSYANMGYRNSSAGGSFDGATGNLTFSDSNFVGYTQKALSTNVDLKGKFVTGPLRHSVLLGYDHFNYNQPLYNYFITSRPTLNVYAPNYWQFQNMYNTPRWATNNQQWHGVYGQDLISAFDDRVHLLLGGRLDWARAGVQRNNTSPYLALASLTHYDDHAFSPRVGLVVQPQPWLSLYGNFTRSFGANNGQTAGGTLLPPQKGEQWEGGVKAEFLDGRLSASMAYFDITKTNIPQPDPLNPSNSLLVGKVRSQGFEFDLTGRVDDNWSVIANYTHDDVRVARGVLIPNFATEIVTQQAITGYVLPGSPRNYGNLWVKYEADGALNGLSVAGGVTGVGSQFGDNANSFTLPTYCLLNGMISYRFELNGYMVTAQLNAKNLTDTRYFASAANRTTILPGQPQSFIGSLRLEF